MSADEAELLLQNYGLTGIQSRIFVYLTRAGASSIGMLSRALKTNRMNIYRNLKKMQNMGLVNVLPGRPTRFSAIPVRDALDILISMAREKVSELESKYQQVLDAFSKFSEGQEEYTLETKVRIYGGRRRIYSVIMDMLESSEKEVCLLMAPDDLMRLLFFGVDEILRKLRAKAVEVKILTNVADKETAAILRDYMKYAKIKHSDMRIKTRFIVVDGRISLTSLSIDDSTGLDSDVESGLWTDSPHYIQSIKTFFDIIWRSSPDLSLVLQYLKRGGQVERMLLLNSVEETREYLTRTLTSAKDEVLMYLRRIRCPLLPENFVEALKEIKRRGAKIKILTSLEEEDFDLSEIFEAAEIRHINAAFAGVNFVTSDRSEILVCILADSMDTRGGTGLINCLWSNHAGFARTLSEIFANMWSRAVSSEARFTKIRFLRAIKNMPHVLKPMAEERGWLLEAPAMVAGESGLRQKFDLALKRKRGQEDLIVADVFEGNGELALRIVTLHAKAIDVKAKRKVLIIPEKYSLSPEEMEMATIYSIDVVSGLDADEISKKIAEIISKIT
ncbi:MAG: helix-turn-helix domain-containing protein [Candidatus Bathyarchaeia archaeon]